MTYAVFLAHFAYSQCWSIVDAKKERVVLNWVAIAMLFGDSIYEAYRLTP
jgi:hypothetical protein